jgi:hypothetical protein
MQVAYILFVGRFSIVGILSSTYPFTYMKHFFNKSNGQSCRKKSMTTNIYSYRVVCKHQGKKATVHRTGTTSQYIKLD